jgi:hypothetical protein
MPISLINECPIGAIDTMVAYDILPSIHFDLGLVFGKRAAAAGKVG